MKHDAGNNLLCYGTAEPGVHEVIFDHCSVSWGSDTQLDWYGSYLDWATFQWTGHGVNTWDYYELNHDGSTHLVSQAQYEAKQPFPAPAVSLDPVSNLSDKVLATAGACKPVRDAVDLRIIKSVRDRTGSSRINTTGPWPDLAVGAPALPTDSDHDGLPDAWERSHGLDPNDPRDGAAIARNGYSNVENYLNKVAGDPVP
jgi:hypothetical protein